MEGKTFPEYENRSFINLAIFIQDSLENVKKFTPTQVMRYIRLNMNGKLQLYFQFYFKWFFVNNLCFFSRKTRSAKEGQWHQNLNKFVVTFYTRTEGKSCLINKKFSSLAMLNLAGNKELLQTDKFCFVHNDWTSNKKVKEASKFSKQIKTLRNQGRETFLKQSDPTNQFRLR